jgi:hypothetical protein
MKNKKVSIKKVIFIIGIIIFLALVISFFLFDKEDITETKYNCINNIALNNCINLGYNHSSNYCNLKEPLVGNVNFCGWNCYSEENYIGTPDVAFTEDELRGCKIIK